MQSPNAIFNAPLLQPLQLPSAARSERPKVRSRSDCLSSKDLIHLFPPRTGTRQSAVATFSSGSAARCPSARASTCAGVTDVGGLVYLPGTVFHIESRYLRARNRHLGILLVGMEPLGDLVCQLCRMTCDEETLLAGEVRQVDLIGWENGAWFVEIPRQNIAAVM